MQSSLILVLICFFATHSFLLSFTRSSAVWLKNETLFEEIAQIKTRLQYLESDFHKLHFVRKGPEFEILHRSVPNSLREWGYINAAGAPYNATGNGVTDDTNAIQRALNDCNTQGGGIVWLPVGTYFIGGTLVVYSNCVLKGVASVPPREWGSAQHNGGTTLLAVSGHGNPAATPFITLRGHGAGVEGLSIFYPKQIATNPPVPYPWTIQTGPGNWENVFVQNVFLVNPYNGIDFASNPSPRHYIRNVFGQPLNIGIVIDQCYDIGRVSTIHFWPFWSSNPNLLQYVNNNAFTIILMRTDWEIVDNFFSWGYHVGLQLTSSSHGAANGQLSNINFDNVDVGIDVYETQPYGILISNLNVANAGGGTNRLAIWGHPNGNAHLVIRGGSFWGQLNGVLLWQMESGHVALSDSIFTQWNPQNPAVNIENGRALISTNYFQDLIGTAIRVGASADRVLIANNELIGNKIINNGPHTVLSGNDP